MEPKYFIMRFKEWLIREMAQVYFAKPVDLGGILFDGIDMRFEDYPRNTEEEKNFLRRVFGLNADPYYGKLPHSSHYLVYDGHDHKISPSAPSGHYLELPSYGLPTGTHYGWWDYAAVTYKNRTVKRPLKSRGAFEDEPPYEYPDDDE